LIEYPSILNRFRFFKALPVSPPLNMTLCNHTTLVLLPEKKKRVRCRHCHLILDGEELGDGYCPECFETSGKKHYDFEEMEPERGGVARYRCEECGAIVESA
jgi:DNA-directed RNA polymerase subunit RPC12/RpoP